MHEVYLFGNYFDKYGEPVTSGTRRNDDEVLRRCNCLNHRSTHLLAINFVYKSLKSIIHMLLLDCVSCQSNVQRFWTKANWNFPKVSRFLEAQSAIIQIIFFKKILTIGKIIRHKKKKEIKSKIKKEKN